MEYRPPLDAAASVAAAFLVLAALPPLWAASSWLLGRPGADGIGAVAVLLDGLLLMAAGVQTWWRPRDWWPWATGAGLALGALQWLLELLALGSATWLVSALAAVLLVWFVLDRAPRPAPEARVDLGRWDPLTPDQVVDVLRGLDRPWWLAGGWAIDLHVGRRTREHADTDVLVLREDLPAAQRHLDGWDLHAADPPGTLRPWEPGEVLPAHVHDVWCRPTASAPWAWQLMVSDAPEGTWTYRRDPRITRPVAELDGPASDAVRRVLAPEVQLLHKSARPRPKDEADLQVALPHLDATRRAWLATALRTVSPDHPWLAVV